MKRIIFLFLLLPAMVKAQTTSLDSLVSKMIDTKLVKFATGFESDTMVTTFRADATIINADTLLIPQASTISFEIWLQACNTTTADIGRATKSVTIKNSGGVYTIIAGSDYPAYSGQGTISTAKWSVQLVGGLPVIQLTGVKNTPVFWQFIRRQTPALYLPK